MLLVAVTAAVLAGCGGETPPEAAGRDVVRPALGFAIDVPDGWTWTDLAGDIVLEMLPRGPDADAADEDSPAADTGPAGADEPADDDVERRHRARTGPAIHVAVIDREGITLEAWADQAVAAGRELQADLEVVSRTPTRTAAGREALALVLKNPRGLEPFVQRLRLTLTETRAYALLATAPESDWPAAETAAETCFDSFVVW
ncbi:MAG: hypothetical protein R6X20_03030 [Phycisphaerae bacterium]